MKISREIKIGFYVVITSVLLYWTVNFLKGRDLFQKVHIVYAVYNEVEGLQQTASVYMRGLKIGTIESITFNEANNNFVVKMRIASKYNIPQNSIAVLYSLDILGNKAVRLDLGDSHVFIANADTVKSKREKDLASLLANELTPLKDKAEVLVTELNKTFVTINEILDDNGKANLSNSIANLSKTLDNTTEISASLNNLLSEKGAGLGRAIDNFESVTENLKNSNEDVSKTLRNLSLLSDSLANSDLNSSIAGLNAIIEQINSKEGSLGKLVYNDSLYVNLNNSLYDLDLLIKDLNENPKRYVHFSLFGRNKDKTKPKN